MGNAAYVTLTRQTGLVREMQVIANNLANQATTGFRAEGMIFDEHVRRIDHGASLSMATGEVRRTIDLQGPLRRTGGALDLAIEGEGFFLVETPEGPRLTRNGAFAPSATGELVTSDGHRVLDAGGAPVFLPPGAARVDIAADGTISENGQPLGQLGVVVPEAPGRMTRAGGVLFDAPEGWQPAAGASVLQGYVEQSNVRPVAQIARMIEVQRAYEAGQAFLEREDDRIRTTIRTLNR